MEPGSVAKNLSLILNPLNLFKNGISLRNEPRLGISRDMLNLWMIQLQAINVDKNIFRQYEIYGGEDLFKRPVLTISYGRIGRVSTTRHYLFESDAELRQKTQALLKKRLSSKKRIGTNYQITFSSLEAESTITTEAEGRLKSLTTNVE